METIIALLFILGISIGFSWWCGTITREKGHGFSLGFILGLVLGMLGLIICLVMSPTKDAAGGRRKLRRPGSGTRPARPVSRSGTRPISASAKRVLRPRR